ncbi:MAG: hypothetical protein JO134_20840 [Xanthobacteraceae bacterium]|nr:hypothetical protein [Xanthobacteraceae bacterium]
MKLLRLCLTLSAMLAVPGAALAQTDYSAGKSAPQLFSSDCSACHQSPRGLGKGRDASALGSFLREHYTTGGASAGLLANYLAGQPAGGTPRPPAAVESERTKPGEARKPKPAATEAEREGAKPPATQAEREPAKPVSVDPLSTKLRGYATSGEAAIPVAAAPAEDTAQPTAAPAAVQPTESAPSAAPSPAEPAPATPGEPSQSGRPPG